LPRPYWALSTLFITIQPLTGATRSKAAYRLYGTLLGATAAIILVPNLVAAPELLTLAIALWVGVCLYFSLLDRTPRSYVLMLAGYTAAFIGFPTVGDPGAIFDIGVARAEEIGLGILCASLVDSIVLPQSVAPAIADRLDQWIGQARGWSASVIGRFPTSGGQAERLRLASGAIAFDALATPLRYDMSGAERSAEAMATLRQHMLMFVPVVSAIADRRAALEQARDLPGKARLALDQMSAWMASGTTDPRAAERLRRAIAEMDSNLDGKPNWTALVTASLVVRLKDLIDLRQDAQILHRHILDGTPAGETLAFPFTAKARSIRHRDHGIALLSAIAAFLAILLASAIWIATAWPDGSAAPMMAAVGCSFFAMQDDPAPQILGLANGALIGAVGAGVFLFAILPAATSFEMLVLALAPVLVLCGLLMTQPRTALTAMGIAVIGFTLLALQGSYVGDFTLFSNTAIAVVAGIWIAAVVTRLVRSVGGAWSARRLRRDNRGSLAQAADRDGPSDALELAALMLDRVGLIAPRLAALPTADAEWTADLFAEVRAGIDVVELRRIRAGLSEAQAGELNRLMSAVARHFRTAAAHPPAPLLAEVDACLDLFALDTENVARRRALLGLTDLRRALFPNAAPYEFGGSSTFRPELAA
jgi:uncharacterized membrane protein YccC